MTKEEEKIIEDFALTEAANDYGLNIRKGYPRVMDEVDRYIYNAFKAGAQWQKGAMIKKAIPAKVVNDECSGCVVDCENGCLVMPRHAYTMTDKLYIIIIKDDEL